jgi:hypothetical protein
LANPEPPRLQVRSWRIATGAGRVAKRLVAVALSGAGRREVLGFAGFGRAEQAFDLVENGVEQVAGGVAAGEVQRPAGAGEFAADGEAAGPEIQDAARASGAGRGDGLGLGALGFEQDRQEGAIRRRGRRGCR